MDVSFKLGETKFNKLNYRQQLIVKKRGRPQPDLDIESVGKSRGKTYKRQFNKDVYLRNNWLCGCSDKNALFCFPCVLFGDGQFGYGNDGIAWMKRGVRDLVHLSEKLKKHENSKTHIDNQIRFALFGNVNIQAQLDSAYWTNIQKRNQEVTENRYVLSKIVDRIKFCGAFELAALEGHDENRVPIVDFRLELDKTLAEHIKRASIFKGTSKNIQNDILECMLDVYQAEILREINETPFVAMMAHEIGDVSAKFQMAIVLRYVKTDGTPVERFWTLVRSSDDILDIIEQILKNNKHKLIAQSYDGSAAEHHQALVKQKYENAHFVHCYAHQWNLAVLSRASQVRLFFEDLNDVSRFFSHSSPVPQRVAVLDKVVGRNRPTSWNFTANIVYEYKDSITECLQQLEEGNELMTCKEARAIRRILEEPNFTFWLNFFRFVIPHVDILYNRLQRTGQSQPSEIEKAVNIFEQCIINVRNKIGASHAACVEICNVIIKNAKERFAFTNHLVAASLLNSENFRKYYSRFPEEELDLTCSSYKFLNKQRLHTELSVLYSNLECRTLHGAVLFLKFLISNRLDETMTETKKLFQILLTTPMTTDEAERNFFTSKRIKTFLRNSVCDDGSAAALLMLSIEKKYIASIPNFNEKLIETFAEIKDEQFRLQFNKTLYAKSADDGTSKLPRKPPREPIQILGEISSKKITLHDVFKFFDENYSQQDTASIKTQLALLDKTMKETRLGESSCPKRPKLDKLPDEVEVEVTEPTESEIKIEFQDKEEEPMECEVEQELSTTTTIVNDEVNKKDGDVTVEAKPASAPEEYHPIQVFFDSMARTVMRFPPPLAVRAKFDVLRVVSNLELEMWQNRPGASASTNLDQSYCTKKSITEYIVTV